MNEWKTYHEFLLLTIKKLLRINAISCCSVDVNENVSKPIWFYETCFTCSAALEKYFYVFMYMMINCQIFFIRRKCSCDQNQEMNRPLDKDWPVWSAGDSVGWACVHERGFNSHPGPFTTSLSLSPLSCFSQLSSLIIINSGKTPSKKY